MFLIHLIIKNEILTVSIENKIISMSVNVNTSRINILHDLILFPFLMFLINLVYETFY